MEPHRPASSRYSPGNHRLLLLCPPVGRPRRYRGILSSPVTHSVNNNLNLRKSLTSNLTLCDRQSLSASSSIKQAELMDSYSCDSGLGTMTQGKWQQISSSLSNKIPVNVSSSQLPVHHTSSKGTQEGLLFPKYKLDSASKCIMCKACGIFFTHDAFLFHLHDTYGKTVSCYGQCLELTIDAPSQEQIEVFQKLLSRLNASQHSGNCSTGSHQIVKKPVTQSTSKPSSPIKNTWTKGIQETVLASEKLLQETSDYLRSSARKMKHRRQNSLQLRELSILSARSDFDTTSGMLPTTDKPNATVPIINMHNPNRRSKRSLQNYFSVDQTSNKEDKPPSTTQKSHDFPFTPTERNHESVTSKEENTGNFSFVPNTDNGLKGRLTNSPHVKAIESNLLPMTLKSNQLLSNTTTKRSEDSATLKEEINSSKVYFASHTADVLRNQLTDSLRVEHLEFNQPGSGDATSSAVDDKGNGLTVNDLLTSNLQGSPGTHLQDNKDDPVYILQTAQDLINLAAHKIQQKRPIQAGESDWRSRYQTEHALRLKCEARIQELKGMLKEEQKHRRELDIQLRAMRLQNI